MKPFLFAPIIAIAASALLSNGCKTVDIEKTITPERVQSITKLGTYIGASASLRDSEVRESWKRALAGLDSLINQQSWDIAAVASILRNAGVDELNSAEGDLIITGTMFLFDAIFTRQVDLSSEPYARAVVIGARDGIALALVPKLDTRSSRDVVLKRLKAEAAATR